MVQRSLLILVGLLGVAWAGEFVNPVRGWEPGPHVISRAAWGAKPVLPGGTRQSVSRITIHHAGVATNRKRTFVDKMRGLQAFSQREDKLASGKTKPAWIDIPYHYYIDWQGQIAACRPVEWAGDTNTEYNPTGHLLICLEGDFTKEQPTAAQVASLIAFVREQRAWRGVPADRVQTHRDFAETDCPGENLYKLLGLIRERSTP
ncbi:MAG: N-acetylmuramoyl-L-alanine amidase [Chthonomonas sp.]|nr:N-acetylmuramoyl-L-alanine amidase [Chthonomonas sp.]